MRLGHLDELARWVLGFGGLATVRDPQELRELIRAVALDAVERCGGQGS